MTTEESLIQNKLISDFLKQLEINLMGSQGKSGLAKTQNIQGRLAFPLLGGLLGLSGYSYDVKVPRYNYSDDHSKITGIDFSKNLDNNQRIMLMLQGMNGLLDNDLNVKAFYEKRF